MQPSSCFVPVRFDEPARKDQWINSRLDKLTLSRKLTANIVPNAFLDKQRIVSSQMGRTDRGMRTHSILSQYQDSNWGQARKPVGSFQFVNDSKGFTLNQNIAMTAKKSVDSDSQQRIFTSFSKRRRVQSEQKFRAPSEDTYRPTNVGLNELKARVAGANLQKRRVVNIIQLINDGIRWKLTNCFVDIVQGSDDQLQLRETIKEIKRGLRYSYKNMYLFHLNQQPICNLASLHRREYSIFVHRLPKLNLSVEVFFYLSQQIKVLETSIKMAERELGIEDPEDQPITSQFKINVEEYVDRLIDYPDSGKCNFVPSSTNEDPELKQINNWYDEGMKQLSKNNPPNRNYEELKSAVDERADKKLLRLARMRLEQSSTVNNPHKYKTDPVNLLLDTVRHEQPQKQFKTRLQRNIEKVSHNPRTIYQHILHKNKELFTQNIPYMLEKYNISRADAHDLYCLYKCLEQVSANRLVKRMSDVLKNGIDRKTFDEGIAGLGINVAEEVLKNICHFDDFVNWPQFLKIVSISASKTPQEKLNAILKYVKDSQSDFLTRLQVDVLVSTSLAKFLGRADQQGFAEMKQYFMQMIFKQLDPQNLGKIAIDQLKQRILRSKDTDDLISFLFLASEP